MVGLTGDSRVDKHLGTETPIGIEVSRYDEEPDQAIVYKTAFEMWAAHRQNNKPLAEEVNSSSKVEMMGMMYGPIALGPPDVRDWKTQVVMDAYEEKKDLDGHDF